MTSLTDTCARLQGRTVLYVPVEALNVEPQVAATDRALVQRLEPSIIHWTRQIKEVLRAQEAVESRESAGPLEEIRFWQRRCADLSAVRRQLGRPGVRRLETTLALAASSYLPPFQKLARQIEASSEEARSNLRFLAVLEAPCRELRTLAPAAVPARLPRLLSLVRIIWVNSPHYNSRERITALLRKLSNKIIRLCCRHVALERLFEGYVVSSHRCLRDCVACVEAWKECYLRAAHMHNRLSPKGWVLDQTSIFAQVDAFAQRCRDLLEVCDCQQHFGRWEDGQQSPPPRFSGHRGPQLAQSLLEIEETFAKHLLALRATKGHVLDVRSPCWHEDFNRFRAGIKDLEVMTQNLMASAFETVRDAEHGLEILDAFEPLAAREAVRRAFDRESVRVYMLFSGELALVNRELSRRLPPPVPWGCCHAGLAHWLGALRRRAARPAARQQRSSPQHLAAARFLPEAGAGEESRQAHQQLVQALDELERRSFQDWSRALDRDCLARLDVPLLAPSAHRPGLLDLNFDKELLKLLMEARGWERLLFETPHYVAEVYRRREDLRALRENLLLVVRDYNRIMCELAPEERALFAERLRALDRKIQPGLKKLLWSLKGASSCFISECRLHASKVQALVTEFKAAMVAVARLAQRMSETLLLHLPAQRLYGELEFAEEQQRHRARAQAALGALHAEAAHLLQRAALVFGRDGPEVQQQWLKQAARLDRMVEEALRLNVRRSLHELARAVAGDGKSPPGPLFRVRVFLAEGQGEAPPQVAFSPSLAELATMVNDIPGQLVLALTAFPRLPELLGQRRPRREPIYVLVERDEEVAKLRAQIAAGVQVAAAQLHGYLKTWAGYREIWEVDKEAFVTRYRHLDPLVSSFDADIARYMEVANNAQKEETVVSAHVALLDCAALKGAVVRHCAAWQGRLSALLRDMASARLHGLHAYLHDNACAVRRPPETLEELGASLRLLEALQREAPSLRARVLPLHEQFAVLDKYEVPVGEETLRLLGALEGERLAFERTLRESETMLQRHKERFRTGLVHHADDLKKKARGLLQEFTEGGPFSSSTGCAAALAHISELRRALAAMQAEESALRSDLGVFKIDQPPSKDLQRLEKELDLLQEAWEVTQDWEQHWALWKDGLLPELRTEPMELTAGELARRLARLCRELEGRRWDVVEATTTVLDDFRRTVPLVCDLRSPAMRPRHWAEVQALLEQPLAPGPAELRLETLLELGLHRQAAAVAAVAAAAAQELRVERALEDLARTWQSIVLDIVPYKDKGHRQLRNTEQLLGTLEEHQVALAAMKGSRHAQPFAATVDRWERDLSLVLEVTEAALAVQRHWMQLESIFACDDTRRELPDEAAAFTRVDATWKSVTERLGTEGSALSATHQPVAMPRPDTLGVPLDTPTVPAVPPDTPTVPLDACTVPVLHPRDTPMLPLDVPLTARCGAGLLQELRALGRALEAVRRSLGALLQRRRLACPRLCFLGNEELLAALGGPRAPPALRHALPKCFAGLRRLRLRQMGPGARTEATGMEAADGEYVEFSRPVLLDGPLEEWLCAVERAMRGTLHELLRACLLALRKAPAKRDKWAREWPGQLAIVASQIQWTADVTRSLAQSRERGDRRFLRAARKRQAAVLCRYAEALRGRAAEGPRRRLAALATVEAHARDVAERLYRSGAPDTAAFEWLAQLRFYWDKDADDCVARQTCALLPYGYEYQGSAERLVVTPLTERCFLALTLALHLRHGGAPGGPAGCGKTETVKELGRALGAWVLVLSGAARPDAAALGGLFAGLAQLALAVLAALGAGRDQVALEGPPVALRPSCGIFITTDLDGECLAELPPGLQESLRPVAMVAPDLALVAEVLLLTEGFEDCKVLARRLQTLCALAPPQLSPQPHYEAAFGLRALVPLLRHAGAARRCHPQRGDDEVLLEAVAAALEPSLAPEDVVPFRALLHDLFPDTQPPPGTEPGDTDGPHGDEDGDTDADGDTEDEDDEESRQVWRALAGAAQAGPAGAAARALWAVLRDGRPAALVGAPGSGKSAAWRALQRALRALAAQGLPGGRLVRELVLNPAALSPGELYGEYDPDTGDWQDGVLAGLLRDACADERPEATWLVLDGPVAPLWMDALHPALDECRVLPLGSGERITLPAQVSLLLEVEELAGASPAAVSRCGVIYVPYGGWQPHVHAWLSTRPQAEAETLQRLFDKFLEPLLAFKEASCHEPVALSPHGAVTSLCDLLGALATPPDGAVPSSSDPALLELLFLFSLVWAVGGAVDEGGRKRLDAWLREMDASFPSKVTGTRAGDSGVAARGTAGRPHRDAASSPAPPPQDTVYDYYVDPKKKGWAPFEELLPPAWRYLPDVPFYEVLVPTVDTARYQHVARALLAAGSPVLLVGPPGAGKTALAHGLLQGLEDTHWATLSISLSAQSSARALRAALRSRVERRTQGTYVPARGRRVAAFVDALAAPAAAAPLELLRLWLEHGCWYQRGAPALRRIQGIALLAAMAPPGGGRRPLPARLQSRFTLLSVGGPADLQVRRVFGTLLAQKLQDFEEAVKPLGTVVTEATLELWRAVAQRFPPVPARSHYQFCLHDVAKVFQGMLRAHRDFYDTKATLTRLWIHECFRVFSDRLAEAGDAEAFVGLLGDKLGTFFDLPFHRVCPERRPPLFGDFLSARGVYEDLGEAGALRAELQRLLHRLGGGQPGSPPLNMVLFREAIEHNLRELVVDVGAGGGPLALLLADSQLPPPLLEDLQGLMATGEAPALCAPPHWHEMQTQLRAAAPAPGSDAELRALLAQRLRRDLRVLLCVSPAGEAFRTRLRDFPALLACSTLDWVGTWPRSALLEVAHTALEGLELGPDPQARRALAEAFAAVHAAAAQRAQRAQAEAQRHSYVLPRSFLQLVGTYGSLLAEKRAALGRAAGRLRGGLARLEETRAKADAMSVELAQARHMVAQFQRECQDYLAVIGRETAEADEQQKAVAANSEKIGEEEQRCRALAEEAQRDLDEAMPALEEAMRALESLNKKDLTEIKSYGRPPGLVETVLQAVMILRGSEPTWAEAKRQLGEPNFIKQLLNLDRDNIPERVLRRVGAYCAQPDFQPEVVGRVARAACSLCMWVRAMETYGRVHRVVEPKRVRVAAAMAQLAEKQAAQAEAQEKLREVAERLARLRREYGEKQAQQEELGRRAQDTEARLERAARLGRGLAGERARWQRAVQGLDEALATVAGDSVLAAAGLAYLGPFAAPDRHELLARAWEPELRGQGLPCAPEFSLAAFLAPPGAVRSWTLGGLPSDPFAITSAVIVTRSQQWPLLIDPQGQACRWIKNMEEPRGLQVTSAAEVAEALGVLERAAPLGLPVLLQDVDGRLLLGLGEGTVECHPAFRLYLATKLANPHFPLETVAHTTVVNFALLEQGLEAQLLAAVVREERPELEEQKDALVRAIAAGQARLDELEDEILRLLDEAAGALLEDAQLVTALEGSKATAAEVAERLGSSQSTEVVIDRAREAYRPCAQRAALLFFALADMAKLEPVYQFSLDAYVELFGLSLRHSPRGGKLEERIRALNDYHTYAVYRYASQGLFKRHQLLFSFHLCSRILAAAGSLRPDEFNFFLRGGVVQDREEQMDNPCPGWLSDEAWDHITELDKVPHFHGLSRSLELLPRDWHRWYRSACPESAPLPGEWQDSCNQLQRMLLVRSLRPDRVAPCVAAFVVSTLGSEFVEPPPPDPQAADVALGRVAAAAPAGPPLLRLALGPGRERAATVLLRQAQRDGHSRPHPGLPLRLLRAARTLVLEPPTGVRATMRRLLDGAAEWRVAAGAAGAPQRRLLFALSALHGLLRERARLPRRGWGRPYGFASSDFRVRTTGLLEAEGYVMPGDGALGAYRAFVELLPRRLAAEALARLPAPPEGGGAEAALAADPAPMAAVLRQELRRYRALLRRVRGSLEALLGALQGQELLSPELEETLEHLQGGRVPPPWGTAYSSPKPLASWLQELEGRVGQVGRWVATARPPPRLWLGGFTAPGAVLSALLQAAARRAQVPLDSLCWEFSVATVDDSNLVYAPKEGAWVQGLLLEGAGWDRRAGCLVEAEPLERAAPLPCVHFRPVEARRKGAREPGHGGRVAPGPAPTGARSDTGPHAVSHACRRVSGVSHTRVWLSCVHTCVYRSDMGPHAVPSAAAGAAPDSHPGGGPVGAPRPPAPQKW
ncbi:dynein axonemal heavy chain 2 [Eudromia elegans]